MITAWARRLAWVPSPGIVDHEGVDERQVAEGGVGEAGRGKGVALARQPLEGPVLADVDHRVGTPSLRQPPVERQVMMGRRHVGRVVGADRVGPEATRRLDGDHHAPQVQAGEAQIRPVQVHLAGGGPPHGLDLGPGVAREGGEPVGSTRRPRAGRPRAGPARR